MALFVATLLLLFAFTTNVGMLVHAKINLQNAADAAAYAGAAVQARQLTSIAYLNWEMRRAVKEFLYNYLVRGNDSQTCFPRDPTGAVFDKCEPKTPASSRYGFGFIDPFANFSSEDPKPFYEPTVCMTYNPKNNFCQMAGVPGVPTFVGSGSFGVADPVIAIVKSATDLIVQKKVDNCTQVGNANGNFLAAWLYNPDPELATIPVGNEAGNPFTNVGLDGLGVLPRLAILRARIDHLEDMLNLNLFNEGYTSTISASLMDSLKNSGRDLDYFERPVQAYLSAKNNLPEMDGDNGIFSDITVSEILPDEAEDSPSSTYLHNKEALVKLNDIKQSFKFAYSHFDAVPGAPGLSPTCTQNRVIVPIEGFPLGVAKDPSVVTYYSVRVEAKVHLLFSPFKTGMVTLSAYSAAKPFGSRIGIDLSKDLEKWATAIGTEQSGKPIDALSPRFPNLLVAADDRDSNTGGFSRKDHLGYLRSVAQDFGHQAGLRLAGAYAPWEVGFYTVPPSYSDPQSGINLSVFAGNPTYSTGFFQLKAPVTPVAGDQDLSIVRKRIEDMISGTTNVTDSEEIKALRSGLLSDPAFDKLFAYMEKQGLKEYHQIPDPMLYEEPNLRAYAQTNGQKFTVTADNNGALRQLTSWNNRKSYQEPEFSSNTEMSLDTGRGGYSVRFISFKSLLSGGRTINDPQFSGDFTNPFTRFHAGEAGERIQEDLSKLSH